MKLFAAALVVLASIHAFASADNETRLESLKCRTGDGIYQVGINEVGELSIDMGSIEARPSMDVYYNSEGTYVDNTETSEIHDLQNLFLPALLGFPARNDQSQRYTVGNQPVLLSIAAMPELRSLKTSVRFKMRMEIGSSGTKSVKTLSCRAKLRTQQL